MKPYHIISYGTHTRRYVIGDICRAGMTFWTLTSDNRNAHCQAPPEVLPDVVWSGESATMLLGQRHFLPSSLLHWSHAEPWMTWIEISSVQPCYVLLITFGCLKELIRSIAKGRVLKYDNSIQLSFFLGGDLGRAIDYRDALNIFEWPSKPFVDLHISWVNRSR